MEENMNSIILIGNSTFTYTEDNAEVNIERNCQDAKSKYASQGGDKQNYMPFKTITITSVGDPIDKPNCQSNIQQMEPCVFDNNFGQFGYFTQDYSNLTVYLNDTSLLSNVQNTATPNQWPHNFNLQPNMATDNIVNYPFFQNQNSVDFPFIDATDVDKIQLNEDLQYLNIINNNKIDNDAPEYIDINSLVIPSEYQNYFPAENKQTDVSVVPPFLKRNRKCRTKVNCTATSSTDDDDVIFVKEYKHQDTNISVEKKSTASEPRRNPKRQVQLQKVSYDLALKMSLDGYYEDGRFGSRDYMSTARRSTRTNGAIYSPPSALNSCDFKEWPVDGMHEKPSFNPVTKKLEKLPNQPKKHKLTTSRPVQKPAKKRLPKKKSLKEEEDDTTKDFAGTTHKTIHCVLSYIEQVKEFNKLIKEKSKNVSVTSSADQEEMEVVGASFDESVCDIKADNVVKAEDILLDSCILYCLANDVSEPSLTKYFNEISDKEDLQGFINKIVQDCSEINVNEVK